MQRYYKEVDSIHGWFNYKEIVPVLQAINNSQSGGNILEIGIHHGKSFIPMLFFLKEEEKAVAVDVFEDQQFNYDNSGKGCSQSLNANIKKVFPNNSNIFNKIEVIKADSLQLNVDDYLGYVEGGKYRIISIDGCHTKEATLIDLNNAIQIMADDGVIIIDDYFNRHWPGVRAGLDAFLSKNNEYRPFYLNANKLILCRRANYEKFLAVVNGFSDNFAPKYESRCWLGGVWKK